MAFRLQGWKRRLLGISAGLLICATVGCQNTKEERRPMLGQGGKPMGPGNVAATPPTSPVYSNLAGNGPANTSANSGPAIGSPAATGNRSAPATPMLDVQAPVNIPPVNPTTYSPAPTQPIYDPNGQAIAPNYGPQQGYPVKNVPPQGNAPNVNPVYQPQQGFPAPNMPMQNMQGMPNHQMIPAQPNTGYPAPQVLPGPVNMPPLSSNGKLEDVKGPDLLPATVMNRDPKLEAPSLLLPVSGISDQLVAPGELPPLKVLSSGAKRLPPEVKSSVPAPENELVVPAPVTIIK